MTQKHLSSREKTKILKLSAAGMSANTVGKQIKRNRRTVQKFLDEPSSKAILADMYERLNRKILESVTAEDIEKATLQQKSVSAAIMTDKALLLRGEPTQITVSYLLEAVELIREMREQGRTTLPQLRDATDAGVSVVEVKES
jgi:hypothetical protein